MLAPHSALRTVETRTSGLACRALIRSGEKLTGLSLVDLSFKLACGASVKD